MVYKTRVNGVSFNCSDTSDEIVITKGKEIIGIRIGEIEDFISWYKTNSIRQKLFSGIEKLNEEELLKLNTFLTSNFSKVNGNFQGISSEHDEA